jgi:hypothetical protein
MCVGSTVNPSLSQHRFDWELPCVLPGAPAAGMLRTPPTPSLSTGTGTKPLVEQLLSCCLSGAHWQALQVGARLSDTAGISILQVLVCTFTGD